MEFLYLPRAVFKGRPKYWQLANLPFHGTGGTIRASRGKYLSALRPTGGRLQRGHVKMAGTRTNPFPEVRVNIDSDCCSNIALSVRHDTKGSVIGEFSRLPANRKLAEAAAQCMRSVGVHLKALIQQNKGVMSRPNVDNEIITLDFFDFSNFFILLLGKAGVLKMQSFVRHQHFCLQLMTTVLKIACCISQFISKYPIKYCFCLSVIIMVEGLKTN